MRRVRACAAPAAGRAALTRRPPGSMLLRAAAAWPAAAPPRTRAGHRPSVRRRSSGPARAMAPPGVADGPVWPDVLADESFQQKVAAARVLAVGAGGIGCELLKTLALSGFRDIEVVDMDTIETSNLNRQFLFRRAHVGQSKARVAAHAVAGFAPGVRIVPHQANIKEPRFGLDYVKSFSLVLNGLDNMDARRHVNRLCVAAGVPLVESGTAGYVGQVSVHVKGVTECYECQPKANAARKTYPICTLRNTPDKPIHCVAWAKELLFPRLFGKVDVSDLDEAVPTPGAAAGAAAEESGAAAKAAAAAAAEAAAAAAAEAAEAASFFKLRDGEAPLEYAARMFERLFNDDIVRLLGMQDAAPALPATASAQELWRARPPPSPLPLASLLPDPAAAVGDAPCSSTASVARALGLSDQAVWPLAGDAAVFLAATARYVGARRAELGSAVFDKDDPLAADFVAAAANLRSACYGIPRQSAFEARGLAGGIVHAIATTNAVVAGLIVAEALKLLAGCGGACVTSFLRTEPSWVGSRRSGRALGLIYGERPAPPAAGCMVCGTARLGLTLDTRSVTLRELLAEVLKGRLAVNAPSLHTEGGFWYEEGEGLEPDEVAASAALLPRPLAALPGGGLVHGVTLCVSDQSQALSFELLLRHADAPATEGGGDGGGDGSSGSRFLLEGDAPAAAAAAAQAEPAAQDAAAAAGPAHAGQKRGRGGDDEGGGGGSDNAAAAGPEPAAGSGSGDGSGGGDGSGRAKRARADGAGAAEGADVICLD